MKRNIILAVLLAMSFVYPSYAQQKNDLKMVSNYGTDNKELLDLFRFENIDYYKIDFTGSELKGKTYVITVKEIWEGKTKSEKTVLIAKI